jgi:type IX secretion system PorP/SprF family membrane protein
VIKAEIMKKFAGIIFASCLLQTSVFSQAKPFYTQYILNNYILNPALTGIENYTDVKLSYRNQWAGIAGHPVTSYFTIQGPLNKKDIRTNANSFQIPGINPRGPKYWDEYATSPAHHGIGLQAINDKAGYINRWSVALSYAYHKPLGPKTALAAGINIGMSSVNLDQSKIVWGNLDPNDPAIGYSSGELSKIKPEIGAGLWLYSARYFLGVSVLNIIPGKARFVKDPKYGTYFTPNYFATAGYRFQVSDQLSLLPSVMVQYWQPQLLGAHANVKLQYEDFLWLGAGYRYSNFLSGYSGMIGINVFNAVNISYSYESATNTRLQTYSKGTHEIVLGFLLGNKFGDSCPRNLW